MPVQSPVEKIIESRRAANSNVGSGLATPEEDKFSLIVAGDGLQEFFLELRFRSGLKTCFSYSDLIFFNYDPDSGSLDLDFGGYLVTVRGRGLGDRVFGGVKQKRVAWLREADSEMQDHKGNEIFIEEITISPPGIPQSEASAA